ncbi:MAG TPA: hypothetical protein H9770_01300, partial [Candidatus Fournierella excrementigallinarum]|nr:hypothetical protein [Candidatus Fournierella excrementigallinarum]
AERNQEGQYSVQNFFSPRHISMFTLDDTECKNPIPVSQFLFLDKSAFTHTSNMNYELMYQDSSAVLNDRNAFVSVNANRNRETRS